MQVQSHVDIILLDRKMAEEAARKRKTRLRAAAGPYGRQSSRGVTPDSLPNAEVQKVFENTD